MTSNRDYAADVFKSLLMMMIVVLHAILHGLNLQGLRTGETLHPNCGPPVVILGTLCIVAVNCYFFLSGYFHINLSPKKLFLLWTQCGFYAFVWWSVLLSMKVFRIVSHDSFSNLINVLLPIRAYWFMGVYFLLSLLAPFLNRMVDGLTVKQQVGLLAIITFITVVFGFLLDWVGIGTGFTLAQGIYMYLFGNICAKNIEKTRRRFHRSLLLTEYVLCSIVTGIAVVLLHWIFGKDVRAGWVLQYNNPFIILASVCLALVFIGLSVGERKSLVWISKLSRYSLAVYLITDYNAKVRKIVFHPMLTIIEHSNYIVVHIVVILFYALVLFIVCVLIEWIRQLLFKWIGRVLLMEEIYERICNRCRRTAWF